MENIQSIACPHCGAKLKVKRLGTFTCLKCHQQFDVSAPDSEPEIEADAHRTPLEQPQQRKPRRAKVAREQSSREEVPAAELVEDAAEPTVKAPLSRRTLGLLIGGGVMSVVGLVGGLIWWLSSPADQSVRPGSTTIVAQHDATGSPVEPSPADSGQGTGLKVNPDNSVASNASESPAPASNNAVKPRKSRGVPLFDSDVGAAPAAGKLPNSVRPRPQPGSTTSGSTTPIATTRLSDESHWLRSPWGVLFQSGEVPWLNGGRVLTEVITPSSQSWPLVLPAGEHVWQTAGDVTPQRRAVVRTFAEHYQEQKSGLLVGGRFDFARLAAATKPSGGAFREPLLPHFWGNYFWQEQQPEAAIRFWKQAVRLEPTFAPAHVNLAFAAIAKDKKLALRELALAAHCNPLDAYGIDFHVQQLREQLGLLAAIDTVANWSHGDYVPTAKALSEEPRQVVQVLRSIGQYAISWQDRARALNNAGAYLNSRSMPEHAVEPLQEALTLLVAEQALDRERELVSTVFENLQRAAQDAGLAEHALYGWLRDSYR